LYLVNMVSEVDGRKLPEPDSIHVAWNLLSPGYFSTMKIPILMGRDFGIRDGQTAPRVVVINESLANRALPGQNPVGHRLGDATIIGVVKDTRYGGPRDKPRPVLYQALFQSDCASGCWRRLPVSSVGWLCCLLALGFMGYCRTGEIGVRIALGAPRGTSFRTTTKNERRRDRCFVFNETAGSFRRSEARRVPLASPRGFFVLSRFAAQFTTKDLLYPLRRRIRCFDQLPQ
jgi:MacB-like protein